MAVVENVPKNSHLYFTYLVNFEKYLDMRIPVEPITGAVTVCIPMCS